MKQCIGQVLGAPGETIARLRSDVNYISRMIWDYTRTVCAVLFASQESGGKRSAKRESKQRKSWVALGTRSGRARLSSPPTISMVRPKWPPARGLDKILRSRCMSQHSHRLLSTSVNDVFGEPQAAELIADARSVASGLPTLQGLPEVSKNTFVNHAPYPDYRRDCIGRCNW